jgi:hypothetical protein
VLLFRQKLLLRPGAEDGYNVSEEFAVLIFKADFYPNGCYHVGGKMLHGSYSSSDVSVSTKLHGIINQKTLS